MSVFHLTKYLVYKLFSNLIEHPYLAVLGELIPEHFSFLKMNKDNLLHTLWCIRPLHSQQINSARDKQPVSTGLPCFH